MRISSELLPALTARTSCRHAAIAASAVERTIVPLADASGVDVALGLAATISGISLALVLLPLASWVASELYVADLCSKRAGKQQGRRRSRSVTPDNPAYVRPRKLWHPSELVRYDGTRGAESPILLAADGKVFNVSLARRLYGPGGEYAVMAGRDATRLLARNSLDEPPHADGHSELSLAERASLAAWVFSLEQKYDTVGRLAAGEELRTLEAAEDAQQAYLQRLSQLGDAPDSPDANRLDEADAPAGSPVSTTRAARAQLEQIWDADSQS